MYFDEYNFVPLSATLGDDAIEIYRARLKDHENVDIATQFYGSRPDLTRDQILETWRDIDGAVIPVDPTEDPVALWLQSKVQTRGVLMALTYSDRLGPHWQEDRRGRTG